MRLRNLTIGILSAGILCLPVWGQNTAASEKPGGDPRRAGGGEMGARDDEDFERFIEELSLNPDQQVKIRGMISGHLHKTREQTRTFVKKNLDELRRLDTQIQDARFAGDNGKVTTLKGRQGELMGCKQHDAAFEKLRRDIEALLTPEQKTTFQQSESISLFSGRLDQQVERLNQELTLSQDQQVKLRRLISDYIDWRVKHIKAAMNEHMQELSDFTKQISDARNAGDRKKVQKLKARKRAVDGADQSDAATEKVVSDIAAVLTPKQRTRFEQSQDQMLEILGLNLGLLREHPEVLVKAVQSLKLPNDRQDKIKAIFDDTKAKAPPGPEFSHAGAAEVYKRIMAELTPQEQALVKAWEPGPPVGQNQRHGR